MTETIESHAPRPAEMVAAPGERPPADLIEATRALYSSLGYDAYRWAERPEPPVRNHLAVDLSDARVCLVGSGGVYETGQVAFHHRDDTTVRVIDSEVDAARLRTSHFAYDQTDARTDIDCVFPIRTLRRLRDRGTIGGLTTTAFAFMGGIYSVRRLETELVPRLLDLVAGQAADVVLLVPV